MCLFFSLINTTDLQMKELQDQLEAENYFSVSYTKIACLNVLNLLQCSDLTTTSHCMTLQ